MDPTATAQIDQETASIRTMLDRHPLFAEVMREKSPWSDGARLAIVDCLVYRADPEKMLARMWAWNDLLEEAERP